MDWPAVACWPALADAFPDALVLLSVRDAPSWWESANETIFPQLRRSPDECRSPDDPPFLPEWQRMAHEMVAPFGGAFGSAGTAMRAFDEHNVRISAVVNAQAGHDPALRHVHGHFHLRRVAGLRGTRRHDRRPPSCAASSA